MARNIKATTTTSFETTVSPFVEATMLVKMWLRGSESLEALRSLIGSGRHSDYRGQVRTIFEHRVQLELARRRQPPVLSAPPPPAPPEKRNGPRPLVHGSRHGYNRGCRCTDCRAANTQYNQARKKKVVTTHAQAEPESELQAIAQ